MHRGKHESDLRTVLEHSSFATCTRHLRLQNSPKRLEAWNFQCIHSCVKSGQHRRRTACNKMGRICTSSSPRPTFRRPGRPQRPAEATRPQAAPADLAGGLTAEARPAVVQTAGTTRPSEFAAAVPRRRAAFALAALSAAVAARYVTSILRSTISAPYLFNSSCERRTRKVTPPFDNPIL